MQEEGPRGRKHGLLLKLQLGDAGLFSQLTNQGMSEFASFPSFCGKITGNGFLWKRQASLFVYFTREY